MKAFKKIEQKWVVGFSKSNLVKNNSLELDLAKALFRGHGELPISLAAHKGGFRQFANNIENTLVFKQALLKFLNEIGITISSSKLDEHLVDDSTLHIVVKRVYLIFKTLFYANESFSVTDPFNNNYGDINYLISIEMGSNSLLNMPQLFDDLSLNELYNNYSKLPENYEKDDIVINLFDKIENTNDSIFLTGKAGTGKSTFVHYFTKYTKKKTLLLSFTGIAAVNIGGQTIHSFFSLPFKPLLPRDKEITKFKDHWSNKKIIQSVDTIVIDEVSMLRSDVLEAIDHSLRINGGNSDLPFGGKQMVFIGDIYQLPPIVTSDVIEQELFKAIYNSEYFFDAPAYKSLAPLKIELSKIHRQKTGSFVNTLNKVRDYSITEPEINIINKSCINRQYSSEKDMEIMLCTNRFIADTENRRRLEKLPNRSFEFKATITGDFSVDKSPAPESLILKTNAQIMFVKNDQSDGEQRWVNGTIAKIEFLSEELIEIRLKCGAIYAIKKTTWENRKFKWDKKKGEITSEIIGTFEQFPLKLAWAITIHKSQGLTFERVKIDLGTGAFANGQLYTALSRCKSINGLNLVRPIKLDDIIVDSRVSDFSNLTEVNT
jgi:ATP-dependent DNA helicase PIF1